MIRNTNKYVIDFNNEFTFTFIEEENIKTNHPASEYYLKLEDLSINLLISLKWIIWGYVFLDSISKEISDMRELSIEEITNKSIHKYKNLILLKNQKHLLLIDDSTISSKEEFENLLKNFYNSEIFDENSKIHLKLKVNLNEFLILSFLLKPTFVKFK